MKRVLDMIHAEYAQKRGLYGSGVGAAILDTGVYVHHDFDSRIRGFYDYVNERQFPYDDNGHGTHICGIIGGNGMGIRGGRNILGVAPKANLYVYKILDKTGGGKIETTTKAIYDLIERNRDMKVRVMNISAGMTDHVEERACSKLIRAVEDAWDAGIVVVTAAGNNGPKTGSITVPGVSKKVITVGSLDDEDVRQVPRMEAGYSGRGPSEECVVKPEVLAPGTGILSCSSKGNGYTIKSGTSMAAPVVAGMIVLLLEEYPFLTPRDVKLRLFERAVEMPGLGYRQGWGVLFVDRLLAH